MKQMAQLADMGVSIPQEFRGNMAMAGEWQTVSERVISSGKSEAEEDTKENVRTSGRKKRKYPGEGDDEDEEEYVESFQRKNWGTTIKAYPSLQAEDDDLEVLLRSNKPTQQTRRMTERPAGDGLKDVSVENTSPTSTLQSSNQNRAVPTLKTEPSDGQNRDPLKVPDVTDVKSIGIKQEPGGVSGDVLFKKRKAKNIRQK